MGPQDDSDPEIFGKVTVLGEETIIRRYHVGSLCDRCGGKFEKNENGIRCPFCGSIVFTGDPRLQGGGEKKGG